jgi:hypothetical protein
LLWELLFAIFDTYIKRDSARSIMMGKKIGMVVVFGIVLAMGAHARVGLGIVWGGNAAWHNWSPNFGAGFSLGIGELERVNWEMGLRFWGGSGYFNFNIDTAWHVYQYTITPFMGLYIGVGPYLGVNFDTAGSLGIDGQRHKRTLVDFGARVPIGLRFFFARHFDFWFGFVPNVGLAMTFRHKSIGGNQYGIGGGVGGEIGFRFWI